MVGNNSDTLTDSVRNTDHIDNDRSDSNNYFRYFIHNWIEFVYLGRFNTVFCGSILRPVRFKNWNPCLRCFMDLSWVRVL